MKSIKEFSTEYAQDRYLPVQTSQAVNAGANYVLDAIEQLIYEKHIEGNLPLFELTYLIDKFKGEIAMATIKSIEEKAKAYDEAIKVAKSKIKNDRDHVLYEDDVIDIFPELKESEDERIRKELIFYLRYQHSISENFEDIGKWIAWLEKQGQVKESLISQHEIEMCKENDNYLTGENERIRKWIIGVLSTYEHDRELRNAAIAWLEKQKETFIIKPYEWDNEKKCSYPSCVISKQESEDEKIKKALIEMVHDTTGDSLWVDYNVHKEDALAWLEKQGEHANFRNKIQVGDKVTRNEDGV